MILLKVNRKFITRGREKNWVLEIDFLLILVQLEEEVLVIYYTMCLILITRHFQIIKNRF